MLGRPCSRPLCNRAVTADIRNASAGISHWICEYWKTQETRGETGLRTGAGEWIRTVDPNLGKQRQLYIPKFPRMARDVFYVIDQRLKTNYTVNVMPEHARS